MQQESIQQLDDKENKALMRQQKILKQKQADRWRKIKSFLKTGGIILAVVAIILGIGWYVATRPPVIREEIVSYSGLHWHPELAIYIKGIRQEIPANIGIGAVESPVHTHEAGGIIHLEMEGIVRKNEITLGRFFKVWGKDFKDFGSNFTMTVNGKENTEFGNYVMHDQDKIELRFN